jgi:hypothetical protein
MSKHDQIGAAAVDRAGVEGDVAAIRFDPVNKSQAVRDYLLRNHEERFVALLASKKISLPQRNQNGLFPRD